MLDTIKNTFTQDWQTNAAAGAILAALAFSAFMWWQSRTEKRHLAIEQARRAQLDLRSRGA